MRGVIRVAGVVERIGLKTDSKLMSWRLPDVIGAKAIGIQVGGDFPLRGPHFARDITEAVISEVSGATYEEVAWFNVDEIWYRSPNPS